MRQGLRPLPQPALHNDDVEPATVLEPHVLQRTADAETRFFVHAQRGGIFTVAHHRNQLAIAVTLRPLDGLRQQRAARPAVAKVAVNINRVFQRVAIGVARAVAAR